MATNPEATFIRSIHRYLPSIIHVEGMANPFRRGTPDKYYDGPQGDFWIEYKYTARLPAIVLPKLTTLQKVWLRRRWLAGNNAAVIQGCESGGIIFENLDWEKPWPRAQLTILPRKAVAEWIIRNIT